MTSCKTILYPNGNKYIGEVKDDKYEKYEGRGTFYWNDGDIYIGEFKNNLRDGQGKMYYKNNYKNFLKYDGDFENGTINGYGKMYYNDGYIYEGHFKHAKRQGMGKLYRERDDYITYFGMWKDDKRNGLGTYIYNGGFQKYHGYFKDDLKHGEGCVSSLSKHVSKYDKNFNYVYVPTYKGVWTHNNVYKSSNFFPYSRKISTTVLYTIRKMFRNV